MPGCSSGVHYCPFGSSASSKRGPWLCVPASRRGCLYRGACALFYLINDSSGWTCQGLSQLLCEGAYAAWSKRAEILQHTREAAGLGFELRLTDPPESAFTRSWLFTASQKCAPLSQSPGADVLQDHAQDLLYADRRLLAYALLPCGDRTLPRRRARAFVSVGTVPEVVSWTRKGV